MSDLFSRTRLLIGEHNLLKLKRATVAIFGIGGVGSYTTEALARAGIGTIILIDNDVISASNINRQVHATTKTIGMLKTEVMKKRIEDINPECKVLIYNDFITSENSINFISKDYNYIVDAIDTISSKIDLISKAKDLNIPIISSMGAANKLNPAMFEVADITKTSVCPVAKILRKELKKKNIYELKTVYSKEQPIKVPFNSESNEKVLGSISFVPSTLGLIIASEVVKDLLR